MNKLHSLSVFFPCFNDAKTIPDLVRNAYQVLPSVSTDFEVLVVNDGSTDGSAKMLSKLKKNYPNFRIISHMTNSGYGAALRSGFANSQKQWIFYTDGDGQYDPREIVKLVGKISGNTDIVNGYKKKRSDNGIRNISGNLYNFLLHRLYKLPIVDIDCDFRLIRRSVLDRVDLKVSSGAICLELILKLQKAGARFTQVSVSHFPRQYGSSQFFKLKPVVKLIIDNLKLISAKI